MLFCLKLVHGSPLHLEWNPCSSSGAPGPRMVGTAWPPPAASVSFCRTPHLPYVPVLLALSLFLEQAKPLPTSGPPSCLFPLPGSSAPSV